MFPFNHLYTLNDSCQLSSSELKSPPTSLHLVPRLAFLSPFLSRSSKASCTADHFAPWAPEAAKSLVTLARDAQSEEDDGLGGRRLGGKGGGIEVEDGANPGRCGKRLQVGFCGVEIRGER